MPLLWLSLSFLCGILLTSQLTLSTVIWLALAAAALLATILFRIWASRRGRSLTPMQNLAPIALIVFLIGAARYQYAIPEISPDFIAYYNDNDIEMRVTGTLAEPPDYRDTYTNLRLQVEGVDTAETPDVPVHGLLLVRASPGDTFHYGDRLRVRGKLRTPPEAEDFSFRDYLARRGILSMMSFARVTYLPVEGQRPNYLLVVVYAFKERALENINTILPEPEASLMAGILLGVDTGIPTDLQQAFKNTGMAHIIAISGFNITIIAGLFVMLFGRLLGQRRGAIAAALAIAIYTVLVGADAAVVRAALMGGLSLFARQYGRRQNGLNTLAFVAALMAIFNPNFLWDVGFQLSFAATLGLVLYTEPFSQVFIRLASRWLSPDRLQRLVRPVSEFILFTLAAQLTILPLLAYHFGRVSLISLAANPLILPAQPAVMILGGLALLSSLIYLPLGKLVAYLSWPFIAYTIRLVEFFDSLPHGVVVLGEFSLLFVILYYLVLLALTFTPDRLKVLKSPAAILLSLTIVTSLTWRMVFALPDGRLHLTFLDAGNAEALLVQAPSGRNILINGGASTSHLTDDLSRRLPPFKRRFEWLVIASTQEEQVAALPRSLQRFQPEHVLWSGKSESSYSAGELERWLIDQHIPITYAKAGQTLDMGDGATLTVLTSGSRGAVIQLAWHDFRAILPVGINFEALDQLKYGKDIGPVSLLLLADSGYLPSNPPEWIAALRPQLVVLDVAAGNPDGLPAPETMQAVEAYPLLRTDLNGWIHVSTDGYQVWVEVERE